MSDKTKEDMSAFMDGELARGSAVETVDVLLESEELRVHWARYHVVRDVLRHKAYPDAGSALSERMRECIRAKYVNIIAAAGKELEARSEFADAAALYEQALTVEDLENIIREGLVRVLRRDKAGKRRSRSRSKAAMA